MNEYSFRGEERHDPGCGAGAVRDALVRRDTGSDARRLGRSRRGDHLPLLPRQGRRRQRALPTVEVGTRGSDPRRARPRRRTERCVRRHLATAVRLRHREPDGVRLPGDAPPSAVPVGRQPTHRRGPRPLDERARGQLAARRGRAARQPRPPRRPGLRRARRRRASATRTLDRAAGRPRRPDHRGGVGPPCRHSPPSEPSTPTRSTS